MISQDKIFRYKYKNFLPKIFAILLFLFLLIGSSQAIVISNYKKTNIKNNYILEPKCKLCSANDFFWAANVEASWPGHSSSEQHNFPHNWGRWSDPMTNIYFDTIGATSQSWDETSFSKQLFSIDMTREFIGNNIKWTVDISGINGHWSTGFQVMIACSNEPLYVIGWSPGESTTDPVYKPYISGVGWGSATTILPSGMSVSGNYNEEHYEIIIPVPSCDTSCLTFTHPLENVDGDTSTWSTGNNVVELPTYPGDSEPGHWSLFSGIADVDGYINGHQILTHRGTRGLGIKGQENDEVDSHDRPERIEITFDYPFLINYIEVRSLFSNDAGWHGVEEGDVDLYLDGILQANYHMIAVEDFYAGTKGIWSSSVPDILADKLVFYVKQNEPYTQNSEFAVAKVCLKAQPEVDVEKYVWDEETSMWVDQIRVTIGSDLKFKYIIENIGGATLNDLYATVNMSSQLEYRDNSNYTEHFIYPDLHKVIWYFNMLYPGDSIEIIYHAESINLCYSWSEVKVTTNEGVSDDDLVVVKVVEEGQPVIDIKKRVWDDATNEWVDYISRDIGRDLLFKITITSTALNPVHNLQVIDNLPSILRYQYDSSITPDSESDHMISWSFSEILPSKTIEIEYHARTVRSGIGDNTVTITTDELYYDSDNVLTKIINYPLIQLIYPIGGEIISENILVKWFAIDSSDPDIEIFLYIKSIANDKWQLLEGGLYNNIDHSHGEYNWDTSSLSDGDYQIKIIAVNRFNAIVADTSKSFEIKNGYIGSKISQVLITDTSISSNQYVKDGDVVEIKAYITNGQDLVNDDISADLSGFGKQGLTIADSYDGFTARWLLTGVICEPENGEIVIKVTIYGGETSTGFITADNAVPEIAIKKPTNALYLFNKKLIPLSKALIIGKITFIGEGSDINGIDRIELFVDDDLKKTLSGDSFSWYMDEGLSGSHKITMRAYDLAGNIDEVSKQASFFSMFG